MIKLTSEQIRDFVAKRCDDEQTLLKDDASWPKISIVTPSYNQGRFLERTILSVLNQNYPHLEYIIMDGGSTDGSVEIIRKYESHLAHWASEKDEGQTHAIEKGFETATGTVLAYLNSDDVYLPGTLLHIAEIFREKPDTDVVYGNEYSVDQEDGIIGEERLTPYFPSISRFGLVYGGFGIRQPASFWTKAVYDRAGPIDRSFVHCMDNDLFARFAFAGARFQFTREFLAGFRVHPSSKTSTLQHVAERERWIIKDRYAKPASSLSPIFYVCVNRVLRAAIHIGSGDAGYLLQKLFRRNWTRLTTRTTRRSSPGADPPKPSSGSCSDDEKDARGQGTLQTPSMGATLRPQRPVEAVRRPEEMQRTVER
jgi:glycosyltransferase involved in cell wall biosynthesis